MPSPEDVIQRGWITSGPSELWGDIKGTYTAVDYQRLPQLPPIHYPFDWLSALPTRDYSSTLNSSENRVTKFGQIQAQARSLGLYLPEDFEMFIVRPEIQTRIPSCTGCYVELSDTVTQLPGFPGSWVVRFINDSQSCVLWYLLFQEGMPTRVLASGFFIERDLFYKMHYETDDNEPLTYMEVLKDSCICAESFGEFLFRFCVENAIWFATNNKDALSPCELDYLKQAHKKGGE